MGNAQGPVQEGHVVSVPKADSRPCEQPYSGPPVIYYIIAGQNREELDRMIDEQYRNGRRLLLFKKKPLGWFHVGVFREPADDVNSPKPSPYSERHHYTGAAIGTDSCSAMGQFSGATGDVSVGTELSRKTEECSKPLKLSDHFSHLPNALDANTDLERFHEQSEMTGAPSNSVDTNPESVTCRNRTEPSGNPVLPDASDGEEDFARGLIHESSGTTETRAIECAQGHNRTSRCLSGIAMYDCGSEQLKSFNASDRFSHPAHHTTAEQSKSSKLSEKVHEARSSPHQLPGAAGGSWDATTSNPRQQWRHGVVNLWLHGQHQRLPKAEDGTKRDLWVADPLCLADALAYNFQNGERIICMFMTTEQMMYEQKDIPSGVKISPGITKTVWCQHQHQLQFDQTKECCAILLDLLFEAPLHNPVERYIYTVVTAPATIHHKRADTDTIGHKLGLAIVNCHWEDTFHSYLRQGWRLVDVMVDFRPPMRSVVNMNSMSMTQFQCRYKSGDKTRTEATWNPVDTQTLWIFEKPASRERDSTQVYEGKIFPFAFKYGLEDNPPVCWDEEIRSMGSRGWELVSFVDRVNFWPIRESGSSTTETMVQSLLFFQRPIIP